MNLHEKYMRRCLELARLGAGHVAPNPMVGAVLVYEDRIIGEGYHQQYGKAHAEVNCINSVKEEDQPLIKRSTIYVSLEPCAHYGKTPPCADLIIARGIPKVVVGCRDPFPAVNGKGIEKLRAAGVEVTVGVLEAGCVELNRRFFTFNTLHRPFIILKWAQSGDRKIGGGAGGRVLISNDYTNRLVHKWRSEEASILVGTRTALADDPLLTARLWNGPDPVRLVIDKELGLPGSLKLFDGKVRTIVFNLVKHAMEGEGVKHAMGGEGVKHAMEGEGVRHTMGAEGGGKHEEGEMLSYYQLAADSSLVHQLVTALYQLRIQSVLVEGGARLLQSFIDEGYWDEARVITNTELELPGGLPAPVLNAGANAIQPISHESLFSDLIRYYRNI